MPDIGKLTQISQGTIRISSVTGGTIHPAQIAIAHVDFPSEPYEGAYEFTPSGVAQTIAISGKISEHDITINPIPSNYGRIDWNGSTLQII